ncbi:gamma-glutamylcyclotransferase [Campylobacter sp. RM16188]|uniref:gamma-glutamylcyclotransferase n=1 Tax=Campylobacter sp. RM16188 TaxID=1705725 RepID=UPI001557CB2B|nr:gamma-glutamylcyclotransferase [Campylobacter sp. RM16188]
MYIFGFGSLINLKSAQKSFTRILTQDNLIPIKIKGYRRVWNAVSHINFDKEQVKGVFLNIKEDANSEIWGVAIEVKNDEFEELKLREKNYSQICINKEQILDENFNAELTAFITTNEEFIAHKGDKNSFIPIKYINIIKDAIDNYGDEFKQNFAEILKDFPFELKDGEYTFADSLQNKAAKGN